MAEVLGAFFPDFESVCLVLVFGVSEGWKYHGSKFLSGISVSIGVQNCMLQRLINVPPKTNNSSSAVTLTIFRL